MREGPVVREGPVWNRLAGLLLLAGCTATPPLEHMGPVTAFTSDGHSCCSQAGVQTRQAFFAPPFRAFDVAGAAAAIVVGGGRPGVTGSVGLFGRDGRQLQLVTFGDDVVYTVAHHQDGFVLAGAADGTVRKLTLPALTVEMTLTRHSAACRVIAVAANGDIATAGLDGIIHVYDATTLQHRQLTDHTAGVECLLFTAEGLLSGARDGRIRLHRDGRLIRSYPRLGEPVVALCEHRGQIVAGLRDGQLLIVDRKRARTSDLTHTAPLFALASTGDELLAGTGDGILRIKP